MKIITDAETALKEAEKKALDKETADKVKKIIDALPSEVSSQMKSQILSAVVAYYNLTDDQKKLIDDTIKKKLDDMVAALDDADKIELADMVASITVSTMIKMLPEVDVVSLSEKSAIKMVKDGFDKLTPEQKKLVPVEYPQ